VVAPKTLKQMIADRDAFAVGVYDALSARLAAREGARALYLSGLAYETSQLGAPDMGLMTLSEIAQQAARITAVSDVPLICDVDTGFGGVNNIWRTVREMSRAGVQAIQLEDQTSPKRCPLIEGKRVQNAKEAADRISAAAEARIDDSLLIIGRTDADYISVEEVVSRCNLYLKAGADIAMPLLMNVNGESFGRLSINDRLGLLKRLTGEISGPVAIVDFLEDITASQILEAGVSLVISPTPGLQAAVSAMSDMYRSHLATGSTAAYEQRHPLIGGLSLMEICELDSFVAREARYGVPPVA